MPTVQEKALLLKAAGRAATQGYLQVMEKAAETATDQPGPVMSDATFVDSRNAPENTDDQVVEQMIAQMVNNPEQQGSVHVGDVTIPAQDDALEEGLEAVASSLEGAFQMGFAEELQKLAEESDLSNGEAEATEDMLAAAMEGSAEQAAESMLDQQEEAANSPEFLGNFGNFLQPDYADQGEF